MTEDKICNLIVQHSKNSTSDSSMTEESITKMIETKFDKFEAKQNHKLTEITDAIFSKMSRAMINLEKKSLT